MREIEIKAHADADMKKRIDSLYGEGSEVHKLDHYFRRPGESIQAMRIRSHRGIIEMTCKKTALDEMGENNYEYEFHAPSDQIESAASFFHALGLEDFFVKKKDGWEWFGDGAHIELLEVNDLGFFLEIEILLPFDASEHDAAAAGKEIRTILSKCGADEAAIESRSYRDMILRR